MRTRANDRAAIKVRIDDRPYIAAATNGVITGASITGVLSTATTVATRAYITGASVAGVLAFSATVTIDGGIAITGASINGVLTTGATMSTLAPITGASIAGALTTGCTLMSVDQSQILEWQVTDQPLLAATLPLEIEVFS